MVVSVRETSQLLLQHDLRNSPSILAGLFETANPVRALSGDSLNGGAFATRPHQPVCLGCQGFSFFFFLTFFFAGAFDSHSCSLSKY